MMVRCARLAYEAWCQEHTEHVPPFEWVEEAMLAWVEMRTRPFAATFYAARARYLEFYYRLPASLSVRLFPAFDRLERP